MSDEEVDYEREEEEGTSGDDDSSAAATITFAEDEFADLYTSQVEERVPTTCAFLTGIAGSGKSYEIRRRIEEDPAYAVLSASTGISAVNLNATTIHSLLGFFDTDSLRDAYLRKTAQRRLRELVTDGYRNVVLDEVSMVSHQTLDTLVNVFDDVNDTLKDTQRPIGLILVGDMLQLPPIPDRSPRDRKEQRVVPWVFEGQHWHRFEANTTRLTTNWRQKEDSRFLKALNFARAGQGEECVRELVADGMEFQTVTDMEFDGTTILSENKHVDSFNMEALKRVKGRDMFLPSRRWGKERGEWKNIPVQTQVREGAYVMILANKPSARGTFEYVNGDCGHITGITQRAGAMPFINITLVRTGQEVKVAPVIRAVDHREKPDGFVIEETISKLQVGDVYLPKPHHNDNKKRYVSGQVQYYPIRLAYATTVHKAQGLSLDRVQVDMRSWQFQNPGMAYIAMSRCRSLAGLRLVGMKEVVARNCKMDEKVRRWL